eukprot:2158223-Rhodomonas_salina.4
MRCSGTAMIYCGTVQRYCGSVGRDIVVLRGYIVVPKGEILWYCEWRYRGPQWRYCGTRRYRSGGGGTDLGCCGTDVANVVRQHDG